MVLRQRVRQLDDGADEERPKAATSARLWFEGIGMRNRAVVVDGELAQPPHDAMGRGGTEASSVEARDQLTQAPLLRLEGLARGEERPVVTKAVDADLEAAARQLA